MQNKLVNDFIKAYEKSFKTSFDESKKGRLLSIKARLCEPKMHQSPAFIKELNSLILSLDKPLKIGVIGQFSSGKSSLLNIILGKDLMPTGVVPVTSKPCTLKYADEYALGVKLEDNSYELLSVDALSGFSDQRSQLKTAKALNIYAPIPLLKEFNFIDTPGLDANELDNKSTLNEFNKMHLIIWLSLIDNAGKKSEQDQLKKGFAAFKENSLCVLNGKDKLEKSELLRVLNHAKSVFSPYFKKVVAISCLEAKTDFKASNFNSIYEFINSLDKEFLRSDFCKRRLEFLCSSQFDQIKLFRTCYDELKDTLDEFLQTNIELNESFLEDLALLSSNMLASIKDMANKVASKSLGFIRQKEGFFYKSSKSLFQKESFKRFSYTYPFLPADDAYLALFYNNEALNKEFKAQNYKLKQSLASLQEKLLKHYLKLNDKFKHLEAKYSNILRDDELQSEYNFGMLRSFASSFHELFVKDFKVALNEALMANELFFEKLNLKAFTNYQNATKLSLDFFATKINASREFYELNPSLYSLYYPNLSEVYERLLNELAFYEFESLLVDKSVLKKNFLKLQDDYKKIIALKKELILSKENELFTRQTLLNSVLREDI